MHCPHCQAETSPDAYFCITCGASLSNTTEKRFNGPGLTSFILGLTAIVLLVGSVFAMLAFVENDTLDDGGWQTLLTLLLLVLSVGCTLTGLAFGIVSVLLKNRRKGFAVAGLIISVVAVGLAVFLWVLAHAS
ncbi:MAG: zinc ribbon domain-containing protein [Desulfovibrio sp.]|nr:MAG: zinc ribbon domain-containing protein [Desulfovibrio sp.]